MIRYTNPVTEIQMPQIQVDRNGKEDHQPAICHITLPAERHRKMFSELTEHWKDITLPTCNHNVS